MEIAESNSSAQRLPSLVRIRKIKYARGRIVEFSTRRRAFRDFRNRVVFKLPDIFSAETLGAYFQAVKCFYVCAGRKEILVRPSALC